MKNATTSWCWKLAVICGIFLLTCSALQAQTDVQKAAHWFEQGIKEQTIEKKVFCYKKAVEHNPEFFEALYNLGSIYRKKQNFKQAATYFSKATAIENNLVKRDAKAKALFELGVCYRNLGQQREFEQTLVRAKNETGNKKILAVISLDLAKSFIAEGRFFDALRELRAIDDNALKNSEAVANLIQLAEKEERVETLLDALEKEVEENDFETARVTLARAKELGSSHKVSQTRIQSVEEALAQKSMDAELEVVYQDARRLRSDGKLEEAAAKYAAILAKSKDYRGAKREHEETLKLLERAKTQQQVEEMWSKALIAFENEDWINAIAFLEKTVAADGGFNEARKKLTAAKKAYRASIASQEKRELNAGSAVIEKIPESNIDENALAIAQNQQEKRLAPPSNSELSARQSTERLDSLYTLAMQAVAREDWMTAVTGFESLRMLQSDYKDVIHQLALSRANLVKSATLVKNNASKEESDELNAGAGLLWAGGVALLLLSVGLVLGSPRNRARLFILRKQPDRAAFVYEKLIKKRPADASLYGALANAYVEMGRKDRRAHEIYLKTLELGLEVKKPAVVNSILSEEPTQESMPKVIAEAREIVNGAR